MTTIPQVMARIAVLEREILDPVTGNPAYAFDNVPFSINVGDMPLFINWSGPLISNTLIGSDERAREFSEVRNYNLMFYLMSVPAGVEEEYTGLLQPWFDLVYAKFMAYPHLRSLGSIINSTILNDAGMGTVGFLNQAYIGIKFTLQVTTRQRRLLGTGD